MRSSVGLTTGTGGDGASMTSRMFLGGSSYPDTTLSAVAGVALWAAIDIANIRKAEPMTRMQDSLPGEPRH